MCVCARTGERANAHTSVPSVGVCVCACVRAHMRVHPPNESLRPAGPGLFGEGNLASSSLSAQ